MFKQILDLAKKFVDNPQAKERFEICLKCPKFDINTDRCQMCGCVMTLKTFIPIAKCPENKW
jgi:hypothetical protein